MNFTGGILIIISEELTEIKCDGIILNNKNRIEFLRFDSLLFSY